MKYTIVFDRSANKSFQALDRPLQLRLLEHIEALADNPRPSGVKKLRGFMSTGGFVSAGVPPSGGR